MICSPKKALLKLPWLMLPLFLGIGQIQAWGEKSSVHNLAGALRMIDAIAKDFGNGKPVISPHEFFKLGAGLLENYHLPDGIYEEIQPANPVCNGEGNYSKPSELNLAFSGGSHLNFTYALSPDYLRQSQSRPRNPPKANSSEIFDRLFLRRDVMIPEDNLGLNFLWITWVNFYFEDFLRTKPGTKGATRLDESTNMANLANVYGRTQERGLILRSFQGGKLRTSVNPNNGEEMALLWSDVEGATPPNGTFPHHFVLGDDELNSHWGHILWHTIYALEHNRVCDKLASSNPTFDDDRLYRMARVIMTHRHARIFLENFASEVVLRGFGIDARLPAVLEFCRDDEYAALRGRSVDLPIEFLHAYVFHDLLPEDIDYGDGMTRSLAYDIFRKPDGYASAGSRQDHLDAFYRTAAGNAGPQNVPPFLKFVTTMQLEHSRQNGLPAYVDYAQYYGGPKIESFEDLGHSEEVTTILKDIYPTVNDIDFYVGMLIDFSIFEGFREGSTDGFSMRSSLILKYVIRNFLPTSCYPDPYLYTEEFLTAEGLAMITEPTDALVDLLEQHVQLHDKTPFARHGFQEEIVYQQLKSMNSFRVRNLADFIGLNELWFAFLTDRIPEYQYMFTAVLFVAMGYILLIATGGPFIKKYIQQVLAAAQSTDPGDEDATTANDVDKPAPKASSTGGVDVLGCHYFITFAVLLVQVPVYSVIMFFIFFSERPDLVFTTLWFAGYFMASFHLVLYIADIAVRSRVPWFLAAHHLFWCFFFVMPPIFRDLFTMKVGLILDYFIVFESGLYWMLFWAKVNNRQFSPRARRWGQIAVAVYGVSRLVQLPILIGLFVRGFPRMVEFGHTVLYAFTLILTVGVQASQLHVLVLFLGWKQVFGKPVESNGAGHNAVSGNSIGGTGSRRKSSLADEWLVHSSKRFSLLLEDDEAEFASAFQELSPSEGTQLPPLSPETSDEGTEVAQKIDYDS